VHVKRKKDRYADQQGDQKYPPMNRLKFDDWLLHFYLPHSKQCGELRARVYLSKFLTLLNPFHRRLSGVGASDLGTGLPLLFHVE
jgi:hypothetical protein